MADFPEVLSNVVDNTDDVMAKFINNIEALLGIDGSAVTTSHSYKLSGVTGSDVAASLAGTEELSNKSLISPVLKGTVNGWILANETWTYHSDHEINIPSGGSSRFRKGDKLKISNTTTKYFYVIGVADTLLTVTGGSNYTVADAAITNNYYSHANPVGFPGTFNFTAPTYSASGTDFTSQPGSGTNIFSIIDNKCFYKIVAPTAGSGTGTGIWTLTLTANQLPSITDGNGLVGGAGLPPSGCCWTQSGVANVIKCVKFDGSTSVVGNSAYFVIQGEYFF
jgi:hypothetical protein